jgi:hypothetical protein
MYLVCGVDYIVTWMAKALLGNQSLLIVAEKQAAHQ